VSIKVQSATWKCWHKKVRRYKTRVANLVAKGLTNAEIVAGFNHEDGRSPVVQTVPGWGMRFEPSDRLLERGRGQFAVALAGVEPPHNLLIWLISLNRGTPAARQDGATARL